MNGIMIILTLLSGVALFLFGMSLMGDGLKSVAGNKLELVLYKLTSTPIKGPLLGTVFIRNHCYGSRIRKLWYDEGIPGHRYHHGCQYRYQRHRLDPVSVLH